MLLTVKKRREKDGRKASKGIAPKQRFTLPNLDFLGQTAPASYVAGSLRHDRGFSLQPEAVPLYNTTAKASATSLSSMTMAKPKPEELEDAEADEIYAAVERRLAIKKNPRIDSNEVEVEAERGVVLDASLRADLQRMLPEDWLNLPEAGDFSAKRLKRLGNFQDPRVRERFLPVPDNLIVDPANRSDLVTHIPDNDVREAESDVDNKSYEEEDTLLTAGLAREAALGLTLDSVAQRLQSSTEHKHFAPSEESSSALLLDETTYERHRKLLRGMLRKLAAQDEGEVEDADLASVYVALARLEERQGKVRTARRIMREAAERCPQDVDVWQHNLRLAPMGDRPSLIQRALDCCDSEALWLPIIEEYTVRTSEKRRACLQALERHPTSAPLWLSYVRFLRLRAPTSIQAQSSARPTDLIAESPQIEGIADDRQIERMTDRQEITTTLQMALQCVPASSKSDTSSSAIDDIKLLQHLLVQELLRSYDDHNDRELLNQCQVVLNQVAEPKSAVTIVLAAEVLERLADYDRMAQLLDGLQLGDDFVGLVKEVEDRASIRTSCALAQRVGASFERLLEADCWHAALSLYLRHRVGHNVSKHNRDDHPESKGDDAKLIAFLAWATKREASLLNDLYRVTKDDAILQRALEADVADEGLWLEVGRQHPDRLEDALARFPHSAPLQALSPAADVGKLHRMLEEARKSQNRNDMEALWLAILGSKNWYDPDDGQMDDSEMDHNLARREQSFKRALQECAGSEELWMLYAELYTQNPSRQRAILEQARMSCPSSQVIWRRSLQLERLANNPVGWRQLSLKCPKQLQHLLH